MRVDGWSLSSPVFDHPLGFVPPLLYIFPGAPSNLNPSLPFSHRASIVRSHSFTVTYLPPSQRDTILSFQSFLVYQKKENHNPKIQINHYRTLVFRTLYSRNNHLSNQHTDYQTRLLYTTDRQLLSKCTSSSSTPLRCLPWRAPSSRPLLPSRPSTRSSPKLPSTLSSSRPASRPRQLLLRRLRRLFPHPRRSPAS